MGGLDCYQHVCGFSECLHYYCALALCVSHCVSAMFSHSACFQLQILQLPPKMLKFGTLCSFVFEMNSKRVVF